MRSAGWGASWTIGDFSPAVGVGVAAAGVDDGARREAESQASEERRNTGTRARPRRRTAKL